MPRSITGRRWGRRGSTTRSGLRVVSFTFANYRSIRSVAQREYTQRYEAFEKETTEMTMSTTSITDDTRHELACRVNGDLEIALFWETRDNSTTIDVLH